MRRIPEMHVGRGARYGPVTVFPIWSNLPAIRNLTTGVGARLEVCENPDGASVDSVTIVNAGQHPALLVEGELLEDGWQTRALARDVIVRSGEPRLVKVACVEQHRWGGGAAHVRRARRATPRVQLSLRENDFARQSRVWNDVERYQSMRHVPTASLADQLQLMFEDSTDDLRPVTVMAGQCGVAIGVGGQPLAVEWFASPSAVKAHATPLVQAAAFDAIAAGMADEVPSRRIRRMLAHLDAAQLNESAPDRGAIALSGETPRLLIRGVALDDGRLAHLSILNRKHPLLEMTT